MIGSWIDRGLKTARQLTAPFGGALLFGVSGVAEAGHDRHVEVIISTPGIYTHFATGPRYYAPPPVYVPGYWSYPAPVYYAPRHYPRYNYGGYYNEGHGNKGHGHYDKHNDRHDGRYDRGPRYDNRYDHRDNDRHDDRGRHHGRRDR